MLLRAAGVRLFVLIANGRIKRIGSYTARSVSRRRSVGYGDLPSGLSYQTILPIPLLVAPVIECPSIVVLQEIRCKSGSFHINGELPIPLTET